MSGKLKLRMLIGDYEIVRALRDGSVQAEGIEFEFPHYPGVRDIHRQVAREEICDVGEFNGPAYVAAASRGWPMTALPVFLHRRFRHGFIFINRNCGIEKAADLLGKRIGGPFFQPAANVWLRGVLEEEHGVPHRSVTWVTQEPEIIEFERREDLRIRQVTDGQHIDDMLTRGEIEAVIAPNLPRAMRERLPHIARLWPDYREMEIDYYRRTGIFPIMHVTTIRKQVVAEHPWVARSLMDAFEKAKRLAFSRLANPRIVPLAWYQSYWDDERRLLGGDPWEYGVSGKNRVNLEKMIGYVHQQGMSARRMTVGELFAEESLAWSPGGLRRWRQTPSPIFRTTAAS
ncbi:MAG: ABC transporter substrate-binding protein [Betaproteobacteria bacterium]|nr:ABC transporter substrate-binding protein [Betaproteobacteria bacterium]